jgi:hypothetical protein
VKADIAAVKADIGDVKADLLSRVFGMILGLLVVNIIAVVGAMFAVAKLAGQRNRARRGRVRTPNAAWRILLLRLRAYSSLFGCPGGSNSLIRGVTNLRSKVLKYSLF